MRRDLELPAELLPLVSQTYHTWVEFLHAEATSEGSQNSLLGALRQASQDPSEEVCARALQQTAEELRKIDLVRRRLQLPADQLALVVQTYNQRVVKLAARERDRLQRKRAEDEWIALCAEFGAQGPTRPLRTDFVTRGASLPLREDILVRRASTGEKSFIEEYPRTLLPLSAGRNIRPYERVPLILRPTAIAFLLEDLTINKDPKSGLFTISRSAAEPSSRTKGLLFQAQCSVRRLPSKGGFAASIRPRRR